MRVNGCQLLSHQGEKFEDTKVRLQTRTGIKGKPFENIKFAVIKKSSYPKPVYLEDGSPCCDPFDWSGSLQVAADDILYDVANEDEDCLGLDHADRHAGSRSQWARQGPEIRIK